MKKRTSFVRNGIVASCVLALASFGFAQQAQPAQPQPPGQQQQQQQQQQPGQQQQMHQQQMHQQQAVQNALQELRQMHQRLGMIIQQLEGDMQGMTQFDQRIGALEQERRFGALVGARTGLAGLRADLEAGDRAEDVAREIGAIRGDLTRAYTGAPQADRDRITGFTDDLRALEDRVRAGEADAMTAYEDVLGRIGDEIAAGRMGFDQQGQRMGLQTAQQRLEGLRADIEAGQDAERVAGEIAQIRTQFGTAFRGAQEQYGDAVTGLDTQLGTLEEQIRAGDAQAQQTFEDVGQAFRDFQQQFDTEQDEPQDPAGTGTGTGN